MLKAHLGRFEFQDPATHRKRSWNPVGRSRQVGRMKNLNVIWQSNESVAGRIMVGFNICDEPVWSMNDLVPIVREVRTRQVGDPGASFVVQRGLYKDDPPPGEDDCGIVDEDSAQVVIYHTSNVSFDQFVQHMKELAAEIARRLMQRSVILEIQRNGVTQQVMGVAP